MGVSNLPLGGDNYRLGSNQIQAMWPLINKTPAIKRSNMSPPVINHVYPVDLATNANSCLQIEGHNQERNKIAND